MFTDSNGLKIEKASWGQKINIWIDQKELIGEKLEIVVWDDDAGSPDDPVKTIAVENYDGKLIPFFLDNVVKNLTGKVGAFYLKVKTPELTAINNGKEFSKVRLEVADEREIYSAEFAPQNIEKTDGSGSQKQVMTDYNQVSYLYAHTRGILNSEKLDLELWETKRDNAFHRFTGATVDESGLLKVKINWNTIKKKPGMRTVYAKIICQSNNEVLYDAMGKMNKATVMLFNIPSIMTEAGYKSAVMVEGSCIPASNNGNCVCSTMKLYWGNKVSCDFRKKVVKISKKLNIDPNNFMSAMAHETGQTFEPTCGTFKKKKDESKEGYVGLIQIGKDAAKDIGTTRTELLKMSQLDQLDYIEKYLSLPMVKGKLNTLTDFYLAILFPVDCGKGNETHHIVFDNSLPITYLQNGEAKKNLNYWRNVSYKANPVFYKEGKKEDGKTYVWEIAENIKKYKDLGKKNMASIFECKKDVSLTTKTSLESGVWNVIVTERYTGSKCTHTENTPVRDNCRRGKIEIYDHNKTLMLTIEDCLLEGTAGEDRMVTDSDAPFGKYQISAKPFIMGSSSGENRTAYGPNPRLSFEPINGSGDEADKSNRSLIRIHGGRQETKKFAPRTNQTLMRTHGCIRVFDADAKRLYDWWIEYNIANPKIKPGKLMLIK